MDLCNGHAIGPPFSYAAGIYNPWNEICARQNVCIQKACVLKYSEIQTI